MQATCKKQENIVEWFGQCRLCGLWNTSLDNAVRIRLGKAYNSIKLYS